MTYNHHQHKLKLSNKYLNLKKIFLRAILIGSKGVNKLFRGSAVINSLDPVTDEEKILFNKGEENKIR